LYLGETLTNDSDGVPTGTPAGDLAFVSDSGSDPRTPWNGKRVQVCSATSRACTAVPASPNGVTLDPVWSPSGSTLAYATAPQLTTDEFMPGQVAAWYGGHVLSLYDPSSGTVTTFASARGATVPAWSRDGSGLLYESGDRLWLLPHDSGRPVAVAGPLFGERAPFSYYGEIDWAQQFAWSATPAAAQCYVACNP